MKRLTPLLLAAFLLMVSPTIVWANIPVPGGFGFLAPFWLSWKSMGLLFGGIVVMEALVAHYFAKIVWPNAFLLALVANVFSSAVGLLMAEKSFFFMGFVAVLLIGLLPFWPDHWRKAWRAALIGFAIAFVTLCVSFGISANHPALGIFGSLLPAFFVTLFIERPLWAEHAPKRLALQGALLANGASYSVLVVVLALSGIGWMDTPLASADYYGMQAAAAVREGDLETAFQRLDWARSVAVRQAQAAAPSGPSEPYKNYYPWSESRVARAMMDRQLYQEARQIISETLQLPGLQRNNAEIYDLPELLDQCNRKLGLPSTHTRSNAVSAPSR